MRSPYNSAADSVLFCQTKRIALSVPRLGDANTSFVKTIPLIVFPSLGIIQIFPDIIFIRCGKAFFICRQKRTGKHLENGSQRLACPL